MNYEGVDMNNNPATNRTWDELTGYDKIPEKFQFEGGFKREDQVEKEFHEEGEDDFKKTV